MGIPILLGKRQGVMRDMRAHTNESMPEKVSEMSVQNKSGDAGARAVSRTLIAQAVSLALISRVIQLPSCQQGQEYPI